ncbi:hypothetical protein Tamer19_23930 [Cupriavidus sp. TA19]|uniref:hypothetical protein n=1 Tax=unclassified Cupriavidus TaxID=2640874 RepID=UPI0027294E05|nr:hypothetical protein [Cupriavidus sp. TA19]GLC92985.1 hypothetical protein Tamer19_23930 [Cupriavidus sp. TA19]
MKHLASFALAALLSVPAWAQTTTTRPGADTRAPGTAASDVKPGQGDTRRATPATPASPSASSGRATPATPATPGSPAVNEGPQSAQRYDYPASEPKAPKSRKQIL